MSTVHETDDGWRLGAFYVYPASGVLARAGHETRLEPKVMAVLCYLAAHQGQVVSRKDILDALWQGVVVGDEVLTRCISELRHALDDDRQNPSYIETLPKRGYRLLMQAVPLPSEPQAEPRGAAAAGAFTAGSATATAHPTRTPTPGETTTTAAASDHHRSNASTPAGPMGSAAPEQTPTELAATSSRPRRTRRVWLGGSLTVVCALAIAAWWVARPPPASAVPVIAVLPFVSLGDTGGDEYFGDGLAEELQGALFGLDGLRVVARSAALRYGDALRNGRMDAGSVGRELGADKVLEGSIRREGLRIRVNARLVDVADGLQLWAASYDRQLTDLFSIQDDIAQSITNAMRVNLQRPVRVARPSMNLHAYDLYLLGRHHFHQRTPTALARAVELFKSALVLDEDFALAYTGLADAYLLQDARQQFPRPHTNRDAERAIEQALALNPNLADAHASLGLLRRQQGRLSDSVSALRRATALDAGNSMAWMWLGITLSDQRMTAAALEATRRAYDLDPVLPAVQFNLIGALKTRGQYAEAQEVAQRALTLNPNAPALHLAAAHLANEMGQWNEAFSAVRAALALGVDAPEGQFELVMLWMELGQWEHAARLIQTLQARHPPSKEISIMSAQLAAEMGQPSDLPAEINVGKPGYLAYLRGLAYLHAGDNVQAQHWLAAAAAEAETAIGDDARADPLWLAELGTHRALIDTPGRAGLLDQVQQIFERLSDDERSTHAAILLRASVHALLGQVHDGMALLTRATAEGWVSPRFALHDPRIAALRSQPEWPALAATIERRIARTVAEQLPLDQSILGS